MTYSITSHADALGHAESWAPELRHVSTADLGGRAELVVVLVRGMNGGPPRVAEARIEQASVTRTEGWKRPTLRRVQPREIQLSERAAPPGP